MKNILHTFTFALIIFSINTSAQTVYNIQGNKTASSINLPGQCFNCIINIEKGSTLTIDRESVLRNSVVNGGTVVVNSAFIVWDPTTYNDVQVIVNNKGSFTNTKAIIINNSEFVFNGNSAATFNGSVTMMNSKMKFQGNSGMTANSGGDFYMSKNSGLIAGEVDGDGKAYLKFNGGNLNESDQSYVTLLGNKNYYFNWSNYNGAGTSYDTKNIKINCGTPGKSACTSPNVYGPATLNSAGVTSMATLPVKLVAFTAKKDGAKIELTWGTDMEINSDVFEIERSLDGQNWMTAGKVQSAGNSTAIVHYAFSETLKLNGNVSYRLKMIDRDGTFTYSSIKTVKANTEAVEMNIYPNPATHFVSINVPATHSKTTVQLINLSGQVLKQVNGQGKVTIAIDGFRPGQYLVRVVEQDGKANSFKLMIGR